MKQTIIKLLKPIVFTVVTMLVISYVVLPAFMSVENLKRVTVEDNFIQTTIVRTLYGTLKIINIDWIEINKDIFELQEKLNKEFRESISKNNPKEAVNMNAEQKSKIANIYDEQLANVRKTDVTCAKFNGNSVMPYSHYPSADNISSEKQFQIYVDTVKKINMMNSAAIKHNMIEFICMQKSLYAHTLSMVNKSKELNISQEKLSSLLK